MVIYTVQAIIIIVGNTFAIFVFWTQRCHLKRTYFLLINLAIADFLVGITELTILGTAISQITTDRYAVLRQSQSYPFVAFVLLSSITSVYFLALISLERAFAVLWPIRHRIADDGVYIKSIFVVWTIGLCFFALTLLSFHYPGVNKKYVFACTDTCLLISLLVVCISYFKIHNRLRAPSHELDTHSNQLREQNVRLSKTLFIAIASSLVFWMLAFLGLLNERIMPAMHSSYCGTLRVCTTFGKFYDESSRLQFQDANFQRHPEEILQPKTTEYGKESYTAKHSGFSLESSFHFKNAWGSFTKYFINFWQWWKITLNAHTHSPKLIV